MKLWETRYAGNTATKAKKGGISENNSHNFIVTKYLIVLLASTRGVISNYLGMTARGPASLPPDFISGGTGRHHFELFSWARLLIFEGSPTKRRIGPIANENSWLQNNIMCFARGISNIFHFWHDRFFVPICIEVGEGTVEVESEGIRALLKYFLGH